MPLSEGASQRAWCAAEEAFKVQREVLMDAASAARLASELLPELRARYPTNTDLDRQLESLRQFSYLMREVELVEDKLLEAASCIVQAAAHLAGGREPRIWQGALQEEGAYDRYLDTRVIRLAVPLVDGVRAKRSMVQWGMCLQRSAVFSSGSSSAAGRLLESLPHLAPLILSFLMTPRQSAELILYNSGLRHGLLVGAEQLITRIHMDEMSDEPWLPGLEERLFREVIQGSAPGGERRSFRQRTERRRH